MGYDICYKSRIFQVVFLWQERKKQIVQLEQQISAAKKSYAETLRSLERISDDIHTQRRQERRRQKKTRKLAAAAGNETVVYHPLMDVASSSSDDDSGNETSGDADSTELSVPPLIGVVAIKNITVRQIDCVPGDQSPVASSVSVNTVKSPTVKDTTQMNSQQTEMSTDKSTAPVDTETGIRHTSSLAESKSSPVSPESDIEQMQANAAVMAAISRSKLQRIANPFLRPDSCREDFSVNGGSETESVSGSFVSSGVGALNDEQIESLMVDVSEYQRIIANMDAAESDRYQQMALPARLRHLQDFVKFEPVWIDDDDNDGDAEFVGAAECRGVDTEVVADRVFTDIEGVELTNSEPHSRCHRSVNITLDKKECHITSEANDLWHPLMDNVSDAVTSNSTTDHE